MGERVYCSGWQLYDVLLIETVRTHCSDLSFLSLVTVGNEEDENNHWSSRWVQFFLERLITYCCSGEFWKKSFVFNVKFWFTFSCEKRRFPTGDHTCSKKWLWYYSNYSVWRIGAASKNSFNLSISFWLIDKSFQHYRELYRHIKIRSSTALSKTWFSQ